MSSSQATTPKELAGSRVRIRFKRHIWPILAGLLVTITVFGLLNSQLITGQIAYYWYTHHTNIAALDTSGASISLDPNAPPELRINRINITAPVLFNETAVNENAFLQDLQNGVVHYPGTADPGQQGNVVIFGHSSGVWWEKGNYKFVFTLLNKLGYGDRIFIDYKGTRYIYRVYNSFVVAPTDLSVLNQGGTHMLTLITCTPVGTSQKRLIVQATQVSPVVTNSTQFDQPATTPATASQQTILPSDASLWHDLRQLF